jgi:hypothetical protein
MVKTTILIETETRNRLRLRGIKGDTYDDIINKLLKQTEGMTGLLICWVLVDLKTIKCPL